MADLKKMPVTGNGQLPVKYDVPSQNELTWQAPFYTLSYIAIHIVLMQYKGFEK